MKRNILMFAAAFVAMALASCQKNETILSLSIEPYNNNSKAYINNDYACWEEGDLISVNGTSCQLSFSGTTAQISVENARNYTAVYPADNYNFSTNTFSLSHLQEYNYSDGHQHINNPMAGYCADGESKLKFHNLCALLEVNLPATSGVTVRAIQVKGIDSQMLWGKAILTNTAEGFALGTFTEGSNSVCLTNINKDLGVVHTFYIIVPANTDFSTLTVAVLTTDGTTYTSHCKTNPNFGESLDQNELGPISYDLTHNNDTFCPDWMIRYTSNGSLTPYNTSDCGANFISNSNDGTKGCLLFDNIIKSFGYQLFNNITALTGVEIPYSVTSIGSWALGGCSNLTHVDIPNSVTTLGGSAFQNSGLTSIVIPNSVNSCGTYVFFNNPIETATIGKSITDLSYKFFGNNSELSTIYSYATTAPTIDKSSSATFDGCNTSSITVHIPSGSRSSYETKWDGLGFTFVEDL